MMGAEFLVGLIVGAISFDLYMHIREKLSE